MKKDKFRLWKIGGALLGAVLLGAFGYVFGKYGFPALDFTRAWTDLRDPDATGTLFGWILGICGFPLGAGAGQRFAERYEARQRRREWLARHPEQAAAIQEQKQMLREEERERKARQRSRRGKKMRH